MKPTFTLLLGAALAGCGDNDKRCDPDEPNTICTIAGHSLDEGYRGDKGPATAADMYIPMDSAISPDGTVWFIDFNNYVIREIDAFGVVRTVVGNHKLGDSPASDGLTEIEALQAANNHTPTMAFGDGYLYLPAWHESRIKRVRLPDMMMENVAGRAVRGFYDGDGGPAATAGIDLPASITFDPQGNLVFMDQGNLVVRMIDTQNNIHTIVGQCIIEQVPCSDTVLPVPCPSSDKLVCGDVSACTGASTPGGGFTGPLTPPPSNALCTKASSGDGGPASEARLNVPFTQFADPVGRIAYDRNGDLLIPEADGQRIRKVDHVTNVITTIAGTGQPGYSGDGGPATQAQINHPVDISVADDNTIYFTDVWNHCVRKIDPSGTISTVVGTCHFTPTGDPGEFSGDGGPPLEAQLYKPYGIDLVGNKLYVSDSYNNRLRVVNLP
jgi:hypothetical protein